ncbi:hypothetical protein TNCV_424041 [Trichonephila clavipes]|nr:hypothetical protein TNCV_424041 [Trichonephila clavipes]
MRCFLEFPAVRCTDTSVPVLASDEVCPIPYFRSACYEMLLSWSSSWEMYWMAASPVASEEKRPTLEPWLHLEDNGEESETDFTDAESYREKYLEYYTHINQKLGETVISEVPGTPKKV